MVSYQVRNPSCKRCKRFPSMMGLEPMILVPLGSIHLIVCGGCCHKLLKRLGIEKIEDLANLFSRAKYMDNYNLIVKDFLGLRI